MTIAMARDAGQQFGDLLRRSRTESGLTQEALAERAAISARTVSDIERGLRSAVYRDTAKRLADALALEGPHREVFERAARRGAARAPGKPTEISAVRSGLPLPLTKLLGRVDDLRAIVAALGSREIRVLTIVGPGGIGKTRLAIEAANQAWADFADGAFFVSLAVTRDPGLVPSLIARELRLTAVRKPMPEALRDYLREREVLLVLDTFEHLLTAAAFVAELAVACPRLTFLVTSRAPLRVRGEHEVQLAPLAVPDRSERVPDLDAYPATALFLERAHAVKPDLVLGEKQRAAIAQICRRLDGLPLALELAAVRLRHLPLATLQEQLDHRLNVLVGGPRDLPARHQAMRETIGWSYDLLQPAEQQRFRQLSVFAGGWTLTAAESIAADGGDGGLLPDLSVLIDNNLVTVDEKADDEPRWGMLDVIREFAGEQAKANGEATELARRHAIVFAELAEAAEPELGRSKQESWYRRLQAEQDNLRAAIAWSLEDEEPTLAQRIAGALWLFWRRHGDYTEARLWLDRALAADEGSAPASASGPSSGDRSVPAGDSPFRRKVLWGDAWISYYQGDYAHAGRLGDELLQLAESDDDQVGIRNGLTVRGIVAMAEQRFSDALAPLEEAVRICREVCSPWLLATSLLVLGQATLHGLDLTRSRRLLEEALRGYRDLGDKLFVARTTGYLGYVALLRGDLPAAGRLFRASLRRFQERGERFGIAEELQAISVLSAAQGRDGRAGELAGAAHAVWASMSAQPMASDRAIGSRYLDPARRRIGASIWRSAWQRGQAMDLGQAVTHALRNVTMDCSRDPAVPRRGGQPQGRGAG
ncbi:MAG: helix-turn-helix domain-containing protein [Chloroflexota bacterium]|nr:helix-turn-helix domain-containing protein [Chloroflexota bacterium]